MARRWIRIAVVLIVVATLGFAGNQIRRSEILLNDAQSVERVFTDLSWALILALADLRAAEQAYVAIGQDQVYWTTKVTSLLETVGNSLENLRGLVINPESVDALDSAGRAVADLQQMDARAREHVSLEQSLLASDLVFTDGLELVSRAAANVELARARERTTRHEAVRTARDEQTRMVLAAAAIAILAVMLLAPVSRRHRPAPFSSTTSEESVSATRHSALSLNDPPATHHSSGIAEDWESAEAEHSESPGRAKTTTDAPVTSGTSAGADTARPNPDIAAAADLCTDFGRLGDTRQLPELLARVATLLNASGVIVWVRDATGQRLRPALAHGYPAGFLTRIGTIPKDSENATAAAFRTSSLQVVAASAGDDTSGALATPLMSTHQCIGVFSAELRDGWETSDTVQATATIIAAQLAPLLPSAQPAESTPASSARAHG
ncbi:MAG: GAF domain-containing protein [Acidobacteriota bacterium]|nr:GAF domain-containing protein [Acidobacteriota bacterium]